MRTLEKTRSSLRELVDMAPQEAVVLREDGNSEKVAIEKVEVGDRIIIRPGGKIPVDGSIISGKASINEATITGESIPASKTVDDKVLVEQF